MANQAPAVKTVESTDVQLPPELQIAVRIGELVTTAATEHGRIAAKVAEFLRGTVFLTEVKTAEDAEILTDRLKTAQQLRKATEEARTDATGPLHRLKGNVDALFAAQTAAIKKGEESIWKILEPYQLEQTRIREAEAAEARRVQEEAAAQARKEQEEADRKLREARAEEERIALAAEKTKSKKKQDELAAQLAAAREKSAEAETTATVAAEVAEIVTQPVDIKAQPSTTRGMTGSASAKMEWAFEIQVPSVVPRQYCEPNEALIRKAVADGARIIAGVRIFERAKRSVR